MSKVNWQEILGWKEDQLEDIRFVGYTYIKEGHYKTALRFFEALIVLNPGNEYDLQTLGALYLQTGDNQSALNYLERAIKINDSHLPTLLNRAKALLQLGYKQQAASQMETLLTCDEPEIADQASALLQSFT